MNTIKTNVAVEKEGTRGGTTLQREVATSNPKRQRRTRTKSESDIS